MFTQPVECPLCKLAVPSYSMTAHFEKKHGGVEKMPVDLKSSVALAPYAHPLEHPSTHTHTCTDVIVPCAQARKGARAAAAQGQNRSGEEGQVRGQLVQVLSVRVVLQEAEEVETLTKVCRL